MNYTLKIFENESGKLIKSAEHTEEQMKRIEKILEAGTASAASAERTRKLADIEAGSTFKVGEHEFIVLEQQEGRTLALRKDILCKMTFGKNNNFATSEVRARLAEFATEIEAIVGEGNLMEHTVDLTSDDGLDDYGTCPAKASLLTAEMYRRYVRIIDKHKAKEWWWLATPWTTPTHDDDICVKCVSPRGNVGNGICINDIGVRPFCIFVSDIFVS